MNYQQYFLVDMCTHTFTQKRAAFTPYNNQLMIDQKQSHEPWFQSKHDKNEGIYIYRTHVQIKNLCQIKNFIQLNPFCHGVRDGQNLLITIFFCLGHKFFYNLTFTITGLHNFW